MTTQTGMPEQWNHKVFRVNGENFESLALEAFRFQSENNPVYSDYLRALGLNPSSIQTIENIPYLPVCFFKSHAIKTSFFEPEAVFESSGTTGSINSKHQVKDLSLYEESFTRGFELFYGAVSEWCVIGLLPSYLERKNSSLVYMVEKLIQLSGHSQSGFYLHEFDRLYETLAALEKKQQKTLLIGVTFALLDFAEKYSLPLQHTVVMETGGMKGRRKEMIRQEVHQLLKTAFQLPVIQAEYGMTELLSQAYSKVDGIFSSPPWMKILVRDEEDPFIVKRTGSGTINVIDLANFYSCSFIATDDVGKVHTDGSFEVLGRVDGSDLRGCSLMVV
ncbi:MAG TPA: acyl transferase [Chitinophagaceae bacterium]|nr:acyl transferase [Chitinophagaceae bacterium]